MNILGAIGVMLSLGFGNFNLAAFIMQVAWLLIGSYGVYRGIRRRRETRELPQ
jgi:paired small multidrug resistance pump